MGFKRDKRKCVRHLWCNTLNSVRLGYLPLHGSVWLQLFIIWQHSHIALSGHMPCASSPETFGLTFVVPLDTHFCVTQMWDAIKPLDQLLTNRIWDQVDKFFHNFLNLSPSQSLTPEGYRTSQGIDSQGLAVNLSQLVLFPSLFYSSSISLLIVH